jgi:hypothetical protein
MNMDQQIQSDAPKMRTTLGEVPPGQSFFAVLGREGDTKYMWDKNSPVEVEAARHQFDYFVKKKKYLAFKATGPNGEKGEHVKEFDPNHERYIFAPPMVGG